MAAFDNLKLVRTEFRLLPSDILAQRQVGVNEVEYAMNANGVTITAWDYPTGTVVLTSGMTVRTSQVWNYAYADMRMPVMALVRLVSTIGSTPSSTVKLEGSMDKSTWISANYALTSNLNSFATTDLSISTAVTTVYVMKAQEYKYYRINVTADTNVTLTGDVVVFGIPLTAA